MHTYLIHTSANRPEPINAEKVFVEEGCLHIVHSKAAESLSILPSGKWIRVEYVGQVKEAKNVGTRGKRPAKDLAPELRTGS